jgi:hypothetical protein
MKAKELAEKLLEYPDFDVEFTAWEKIANNESEGGSFPYIIKFNNVEVGDVGHSDKVILLTGESD